MQLIQLIRTAHPAANLLAGISLALLLLKILLLNQIDAPLPAFFRLGVVAESVLSSVVASYVFYLFAVHLKQLKDLSTVRPYVVKHCKRIVDLCRQQLSAVAATSEVSLTLESASREKINEAFARLAPYGEAPMRFFPSTSATWLQFFEHHIEKNKGSIARLIAQLPYIDASLMAKIVAIDDCSHFEHLSLTGSLPVRNQDLSAWAPSFYEYVRLCRDLSISIGTESSGGAA